MSNAPGYIEVVFKADVVKLCAYFERFGALHDPDRGEPQAQESERSAQEQLKNFLSKWCKYLHDDEEA